MKPTPSGGSRLPAVFAGALLVVFALECRAAPDTLTVEPPALPLSCLSLREGSSPLRYPDELPGQPNAVVVAEMAFASGSVAPLVTIVSNSGDAVFGELVARRVAAYRLPCMEAGRSVTVRQTFDFLGRKGAGTRALAFRPRYAPEKLAAPGCTVDGLGVAPGYPRGSWSMPASGTVVVTLSFAASGEAPKVTVLYDGGEAQFASRVTAVVEKYRLRCEKPLAEPYVAQQTFSFVMDGETVQQLKSSLTLQQLLGAVENLERHKVRFDLVTMGCPFEAEFRLYQPFTVNGVDADLGRHPERREFVDWLGDLVLALPPKALRTAIGQRSTLSVPCAVIDLT